MKEVFTFYRAVDPMKGSWDGYGYFPTGENDFLVFVADAPSGASIHTPEVIKEFWRIFMESSSQAQLPHLELADALNRLQNDLQLLGRQENILHQATIVVARKIGSKLYYCCIGDSVLQIYRGGKLYRLSESEIWDASLIVKNGQAMTERQKTRENRFIGSAGSYVQISEILTLDLHDGDILLLYSDGVEDLLAPDQLLKLLNQNPEQLRQKMDSIFAQDKVKDDVTLVISPVRVTPAFQPEKEFASLTLQQDKLQKEQKEMRNQLLELAAMRGRIDKMEKSVNQISSRAAEPRVRATSIKTDPTRVWRTWLIPILFLLMGTAVGAYFFGSKSVPVVQQRAKETPSTRRTVAPPEIPSTLNCDYVIQTGDTLDKIARGRNLTLQELLSRNPTLKKDAPLIAGKTLNLCLETP